MDIETQTRWPGRGPRIDFGLSYIADVTVIALAWIEDDTIATTSIAAPFDSNIHDFLRKLFNMPRLIVAHDAVFDLRQLSKLTAGELPRHIWDTQSMAWLLRPAVDMRYNLLAVAESLGIPFPERQRVMKGQRSKLHALPLDVTLQYAQDDARLTLEIYQKQKTLPSDAALIDWECRAVYEYCRMADQGIRLNTPLVEQRLIELSATRDEIAIRLRHDGLDNPGSSQARARYLYETKAIPLPTWDPKSWYFTRAGRRRLRELVNPQVELSDLSTSSWVIESYMEENSPYIEQLRDLAAYMEVDWLISTLSGLLDHAVLDGRLHSLVTTATESGR